MERLYTAPDGWSDREVQRPGPAVVVAQRDPGGQPTDTRAPDAAYQTQNYQTPAGYQQPAYVAVLPQHLRAAADLVRTTNPADLPSFPTAVVALDRVASMIPWWLVLALGAAGGYWLSTKRHRGAST